MASTAEKKFLGEIKRLDNNFWFSFQRTPENKLQTVINVLKVYRKNFNAECQQKYNETIEKIILSSPKLQKEDILKLENLFVSNLAQTSHLVEEWKKIKENSLTTAEKLSIISNNADINVALNNFYSQALWEEDSKNQYHEICIIENTLKMGIPLPSKNSLKNIDNATERLHKINQNLNNINETSLLSYLEKEISEVYPKLCKSLIQVDLLDAAGLQNQVSKIRKKYEMAFKDYDEGHRKGLKYFYSFIEIIAALFESNLKEINGQKIEILINYLRLILSYVFRTIVSFHSHSSTFKTSYATAKIIYDIREKLISLHSMAEPNYKQEVYFLVHFSLWLNFTYLYSKEYTNKERPENSNDLNLELVKLLQNGNVIITTRQPFGLPLFLFSLQEENFLLTEDIERIQLFEYAFYEILIDSARGSSLAKYNEYMPLLYIALRNFIACNAFFQNKSRFSDIEFEYFSGLFQKININVNLVENVFKEKNFTEIVYRFLASAADFVPKSPFLKDDKAVGFYYISLFYACMFFLSLSQIESILLLLEKHPKAIFWALVAQSYCKKSSLDPCYANKIEFLYSKARNEEKKLVDGGKVLKEFNFNKIDKDWKCFFFFSENKLKKVSAATRENLASNFENFISKANEELEDELEGI